MANVFTGRTVIAWAKGVERIADAVNVIEEFAEYTAPGFAPSRRCNWQSS